MIISSSRRTDIPAFYSDWFFDKINRGFVYVINPFNFKQVSKILLNPDTVDCFVFWTKDAAPLLNKLHILDEEGYKYYFQFTITPYDTDIEPGIRDKNEIIHTFIQLSDMIGREKVIFRYDPILLSGKYTKAYHYARFEGMCNKLHGSTEKCVISFLDMYAKTKRNTRDLGLLDINEEDIYEMGARLADIAGSYGLAIAACAEKTDLTRFNIQKGKCIDDELIEKILGCPIKVKKDDNQREGCGCVKSIDIGQYNTCRHFCAYCYANYNYKRVEENCATHNVCSPLLAGSVKHEESIAAREMDSIKHISIK